MIKNKVVILANGEFPKNKRVLAILNSANKIICCDGAAKKLINYGLQPFLIIGDLDSLDKNFLKEFSDIIVKNPDQNSNDLTKAVNWCVENNIKDIEIIAATGKREDHTIANISLLAKYINQLNVKIITDYGEFIPILKSTKFKSFKGQQVSIFSILPDVKISSEGLKYQLKNTNLSSWWMGTLNESTGNEFFLEFKKGQIIVFKLYK